MQKIRNMKVNLLIICFTLLLNSFAELNNENGYKKAINFYNKYTKEFIQSELYKFKYHPRTHYDLISNDSNSFRVLVYEKNELRVLNSFGFISMFNLPVDTNYLNVEALFRNKNTGYELVIEKFEHTEYLISERTIEKTIRTEIKYDIPKDIIKVNPIEYFNEFERLRKKFGIINYFRAFNSKVIRLYFSSYDYLIYIPDNFQLEMEYNGYWEKKLGKGKKLDDNWYYFKSDKPLDVG